MVNISNFWLLCIPEYLKIVVLLYFVQSVYLLSEGSFNSMKAMSLLLDMEPVHAILMYLNTFNTFVHLYLMYFNNCHAGSSSLQYFIDY